MRMYDIIKKKRDGGVLTREEVNFFVNGYTDGSVPDEQVSALLMAIYFQDMNDDETNYMTKAITDSGDTIDLSGIKGCKVDKHSTGGVGDKTTLIVAPTVASCGVKVAKMTGRGLGHTGGTADKLESIPGFSIAQTEERFFDIVNEIGVCIVGQTGNLTPADKKLYALRDITATVDKMPLIASSIMGKKLALGSDGIVLDVKVGSGSFNKTFADAEKLANKMVSLGRAAGKNTKAIISNMDKPLGYAIGNAIEVREAIEVLNGHGDEELITLCTELSAAMINISGIEDMDECRQMAYEHMTNGKALEVLKKLIKAEGGDENYIDDPSLLKIGTPYDVYSPFEDGFITAMDASLYGIASMKLGAGRSKKEDIIDSAAGIHVYKKYGDYVKRGDKLATLYATDENLFADSEKTLLSALTIGKDKPAYVPIVLGTV